MLRLEFWPDYGSGPLWSDEGKPLALGSLGISPMLAERVRLWNSQYEEGKIPVDGPGDVEWLTEGVGCCTSCAQSWVMTSRL
jgi:hypothetical protein